ncbi:MAG: hypothetical protein OH319_02570 [Candidatus Parvarchaeota archaeon]|nr:hypothetical protein [Candidatus Jingweiarchaeum tengchongense]MCW1298253.1 hypothetical protein [Candidatus Jingweiarchaeum tengchongense]MCW1300050.1 hypothetical protein [Candidatus Jingweiarchaeum tengchongense]MCW1304811.1 hypothetical protein [Candidatus Jingweiarchaeum tengchongense]MCW1305401.1 hypothetical protein [Candidatus Jingweiarchaeum tengchongense]
MSQIQVRRSKDKFIENLKPVGRNVYIARADDIPEELNEVVINGQKQVLIKYDKNYVVFLPEVLVRDPVDLGEAIAKAAMWLRTYRELCEDSNIDSVLLRSFIENRVFGNGGPKTNDVNPLIERVTAMFESEVKNSGNESIVKDDIKKLYSALKGGESEILKQEGCDLLNIYRKKTRVDMEVEVERRICIDGSGHKYTVKKPTGRVTETYKETVDISKSGADKATIPISLGDKSLEEIVTEKYFPTNEKTLKQSGIGIEKEYLPEIKEVGRRVLRTMMNNEFGEAYYTGPKSIDEFEESFKQELREQIGKVAKFEYNERENINLKRLSQIIEKAGYIVPSVQMKEKEGKIIYELRGYERGKIIPKIILQYYAPNLGLEIVITRFKEDDTQIVNEMFPVSTRSIENIVSKDEAEELLYHRGAREKIVNSTKKR